REDAQQACRTRKLLGRYFGSVDPAMFDIFPSFGKAQAPLLYYRVDRMVLSPRHWGSCKLAVQLNWKPVKFKAANAKKVPKNQKGVYSFVVKPRIANHKNVSYLIYVGKAQKQSFQARYRQYLGHFRKGEKSKWFHVAMFLHKWQDHLWFYW